ncbi:MAG TPA: hypothetical protein VLL08_17510 [Kineosporiaceae bacterium]|nr:hypothetical protein [Kineosporiaceae bacterium]
MILTAWSAIAWSAVSVSSIPLSPAAQAADSPRLRVLAVRSTLDQVSVVFELQPRPRRPLANSAVVVTSGAARLPNRLSAILSDRASVGFVLDASADGAAALRDGGRAGAASLLLQLPPGAISAVIADRRPPAVAAPPSVGVLDDLQATSVLPSGGSRATSAALTLALRTLQPGPGIAPVIVLYTNAANAGGESAAGLGARLRQANTVLVVISTSPNPQFWRDVAPSTGGFAIAVGSGAAITSFDAVANGLGSRYSVTFARPVLSAGPLELAVDTGSKVVTADVTVPAEPVVETSDATPTHLGETSPFRSWFWLPGAGLLVVAVVGIVLAARRDHRRRRRPDQPQTAVRRPPEMVRQPALPGVRVFDVADPTGPREITNQLFESRMERDARSHPADDSPPGSPD